jgi:antibiotic biosynthesis monooxygenase
MSTEHHYVIVTFHTDKTNQSQAVTEIGDYVADFLSQQPGFVTSSLFASRDGQSIVHQAQWTSEAAFLAAGPLARAHPDFPKLMTYEPKGIGYQLERTF